MRNVNQSHNPCDNFYEFACGEWIKKNKQETDQFTMAIDNLLDDLTSVMKEPINQKKDSKIVSSVKEFYKTCTNESDIEDFSDIYLYKFFRKEFGDIPMLPTKKEFNNNFESNNALGFLPHIYYGIEKFLAQLTIFDMPLIFRFKSGTTDKSLILMKLNTPQDFCEMQNFIPKSYLEIQAFNKLIKEIMQKMKSKNFYWMTKTQSTFRH